MAAELLALIGTLALGPAVPVQRPKSMGPSAQAEPVPVPVPVPESEPESEAVPESESEPESEPEPESESEPEPEPAPEPLDRESGTIELAEDDNDDAEPPPAFQRRGILLAPALGIAACGNDWCEGYRAGFWGQADLGYRFGIVAPIVGFGGGVGPFDTASLEIEGGPPFDDKGRITFFDAGVGVLLFPVRKGRIDPFFGARIGYSRVTLSATGPDGLGVRETLSRGGIRIGGGLSVFLSKSVQLGPRIDITIPFAGKDCADTSFMGLTNSECIAVKDLEENARVDSTELALPWSVAIEVRVLLGV